MKYAEWQASVPDEIKGDSLWRLEVYRLGLFAAEIAWQDALVLNKTPLTRGLADQLYRAYVPFQQISLKDTRVLQEKTVPAFLNTHLVLQEKHVIGISNHTTL